MSKIVKGVNKGKPYTVRTWQGRTKREKSFGTLAEARRYMTDVDASQRYGAADTRAAKTDFGTACETWIARHPGAPRTADLYRGVLRTWITPTLGGRSLASVAGDRDAVAALLAGKMGHLSLSRREAARSVIVGTLDEAVNAGSIPRHRAAGIKLSNGHAPRNHGDFVFPSHDQVAAVADAAGIAVWLMRGCGLRISEALAVEKADFRDRGRVLRLAGQASLDGSQRVPLKHRKPGEWRDVPVPAWLWAMVKGLPDGPLCPGRTTRYATYGSVAQRFSRAARAAGIPSGFTPHSLRHCFASVLLGSGVPITDVAAWLGHADIRVTYKIYSHLIPSAAGRAADLLDAEYKEWTS